MAACAFCFATVAEGDATCPRCGRAVGSARATDDRPTLTSWTPPSAPAPVAPVPVPEPPVAPAPAWTAPTEPDPRPVAPWRPPDASGAVPPAPTAPSSPPAAWPPPPPSDPAGWPAAGAAAWPGPATPLGGAPPLAGPAAGPDLDRSNAIVLVVVAAFVALGIILLAVLATNAIGPDPEGAAPARPAAVTASATAEVPGGR